MEKVFYYYLYQNLYRIFIMSSCMRIEFPFGFCVCRLWYYMWKKAIFLIFMKWYVTYKEINVLPFYKEVRMWYIRISSILSSISNLWMKTHPVKRIYPWPSVSSSPWPSGGLSFGRPILHFVFENLMFEIRNELQMGNKEIHKVWWLVRLNNSLLEPSL